MKEKLTASQELDTCLDELRVKQEIMGNSKIRTGTEHVTKSRRGRCKKGNAISIAHSSNKMITTNPILLEFCK